MVWPTHANGAPLAEKQRIESGGDLLERAHGLHIVITHDGAGHVNHGQQPPLTLVAQPQCLHIETGKQFPFNGLVLEIIGCIGIE